MTGPADINCVWKLKGLAAGAPGPPLASPSSVDMVKVDSGVGGRSDAERWGWRRVAGLLRGDAGRKWLRSGELANGGSGFRWSRSRSRSTSSQVNWNSGSPWLVSRTTKAGVGGVPGGSIDGRLDAMCLFGQRRSQWSMVVAVHPCGAGRGVGGAIVKRSKRGPGRTGGVCFAPSVGWASTGNILG